jgi:hypothetical protein
MKKRVFISFDFDHDSFLRDSIVGQSRLPDSPFEIENWSVKEPWEQHEWKERCLAKIKRTELVLVMVGQYTKNASGVKAEIAMAKTAGVPVVGLRGYKDRECPRPEGLEGYYTWTWENVKNIVHGGR